MKKIFFILVTITLLSGCVATINQYQLSKLQIGMQRDNVFNLFNRISPDNSYRMSVDAKMVYVDVYNLANGYYLSTYFVAYNSIHRVIYWGYPNEFARNDSRFISKIGERALAKMQLDATAKR